MMEREASIDRIRGLSDDILCQILSSLPTKRSIRTSVLSKRWRFLWTHVPILDLDTDHHPGAQFLEFLKKFMSMHQVRNLITFRLCHSCSRYDEVETWTRPVFERNVRNVDLIFHFTSKLPQCIITCKNLVNLSLRYCTGNMCSGTIYLPGLKRLHLNYVDDEAITRLLPGCPVLEELLITTIYNYVQNSGCLNISSPTIKSLTVNFGISWLPCLEYWVKINAPSLTYLKVHDIMGKFISLTPMPSLIEADIQLSKYYNASQYTALGVLYFDSLCNVTCLKLNANYEEEKFMTVKFDNLTKLEFKSPVANWLLPKLLESADNLKVLIIDRHLMCWSEPKQVPKCLSLHLRTIRIDSNVCVGHGLNMVRYLVRNAKVLEKIHFLLRHNPDDGILRNLWFERGSKALRFVFD